MLQLLDDLLKINHTTYEVLPPDGEILRIPIIGDLQNTPPSIGHITVIRRESHIEIAWSEGISSLTIPNAKFNMSNPTFEFNPVIIRINKMRDILRNCLLCKPCR